MSLKANRGSTYYRTLISSAILAVLFVIAIKYVFDEASYFSLQEDALGRFFPIKWWLVGHLSGGLIALLIGPFQFWETFRNKYFKLHRRMGRIYLVAIAVASIFSTVMAWNTAIAIHWTWAFSLQILAIVWITTALMAYRCIRQRRIEQHKQWMIRSYIVTFGFVAFRWLSDAPFMVEMGSFVERAPTIVWSVWAIPLFIAEVIFQWRNDQ